MKCNVGCGVNIAVMYEASGVRGVSCPGFRCLKCTAIWVHSPRVQKLCLICVAWFRNPCMAYMDVMHNFSLQAKFPDNWRFTYYDSTFVGSPAVCTAYATGGLLDLVCEMCSVYLTFNVLWAEKAWWVQLVTVGWNLGIG